MFRNKTLRPCCYRKIINCGWCDGVELQLPPQTWLFSNNVTSRGVLFLAYYILLQFHFSDRRHVVQTFTLESSSLYFLYLHPQREELRSKKEKKRKELIMRSIYFFDVCICKSFRYLQNRKTINELPEPMKNLQRKAWREATRRHRAKKLAQATLSASSMSQTPSLWPGHFFKNFYFILDSLLSGQKCAHFVYVYLWILELNENWYLCGHKPDSFSEVLKWCLWFCWSNAHEDKDVV